MKISQVTLKLKSDYDKSLELLAAGNPDLLIVFASVAFFELPTFPSLIQRLFPSTTIVGCSTAGEIAIDRVYDNTCVITSVKFENSSVKSVSTRIEGMTDSHGAGTRLAAALPKENLGIFSRKAVSNPKRTFLNSLKRVKATTSPLCLSSIIFKFSKFELLS